jgi:hypothetical protein
MPPEKLPVSRDTDEWVDFGHRKRAAAGVGIERGGIAGVDDKRREGERFGLHWRSETVGGPDETLVQYGKAQRRRKIGRLSRDWLGGDLRFSLHPT